jgi:hypothetical protein
MMRWFVRLARPTPRQLLAPDAPDEVLLQGVQVLRAVGARILRYDAEAGTLEARVAPWSIPGVVRLRVVADGPRARVTIESDAPGSRWLVCLLGRELARGMAAGGPDDPTDREGGR